MNGIWLGMQLIRWLVCSVRYLIKCETCRRFPSTIMFLNLQRMSCQWNCCKGQCNSQHFLRIFMQKSNVTNFCSLWKWWMKFPWFMHLVLFCLSKCLAFKWAQIFILFEFEVTDNKVSNQIKLFTKSVFFADWMKVIVSLFYMLSYVIRVQWKSLCCGVQIELMQILNAIKGDLVLAILLSNPQNGMFHCGQSSIETTLMYSARVYLTPLLRYSLYYNSILASW